MEQSTPQQETSFLFVHRVKVWCVTHILNYSLVRELASLASGLMHAALVVRAGWTFARRLIAIYSKRKPYQHSRSTKKLTYAIANLGLGPSMGHDMAHFSFLFSQPCNVWV